MMKRIFSVVLVLFLTLVAQIAYAHKPSDSYLSLKLDGNKIAGQWDIALRDLDFALGLDANADGQITWGEVRSKHQEITAYALSRLQIRHAEQVCPNLIQEHLIDDHTDGAYAVLRFSAQCSANIEQLQIQYGLFFDIDPQHKGLLRLQAGEHTSTVIFGVERPTQNLSVQHANKLQQFLDYARDGVWHIWIGYDHILFLLALLLPAVVVRKERQWQAVAAFAPAFFEVLKIVTAFTIAHSITLSLATLDIIALPSRLVESTIAASVILAALNNIYPLFRERRWMMAFIFGLIHGFGFASVLGDLGLPQNTLVLALVGFNLGVEAGQLAIVALFLPATFLIRHTMFYRRVVLYGGSAVIALLATIWFLERAVDMKILPF